jgi:Xaa-Pro aminopeptidase
MLMKIITFLISILLLTTVNVFSQVQAKGLGGAFHKSRRSVVRSMMPPESVFFALTSDLKQWSNDINYKYKQDPNFLYLTGVKEPESVLVMLKEEITIKGTKTNELLFLQIKDSNKYIWNGGVYGNKVIKELSGVDVILPNCDFTDFINSISYYHYQFYVSLPNFSDDHLKVNGSVRERLNSLEQVSNGVGMDLNTSKSKGWLNNARSKKTVGEIEFIKKSVSITSHGLSDAIKAVKPGLFEYQLKAITDFRFSFEGGDVVGFPSVIGSGNNSCILKHSEYESELRSGEVVVIDVGMSFGGYIADLTRTVPVSGKFTNEQIEIYNIVLKAQKSAISSLAIDSSFIGAHEAAVKVVASGLLDLGVISDENDYIKYFMHATCHYLGLDVHDPGNYYNLEVGNVLTVEPGIYIPVGSDCPKKYWGIGIRIEDVILMNASGAQVLSESLVKEINDIEELMKK